jgi:hypothetical protein
VAFDRRKNGVIGSSRSRRLVRRRDGDRGETDLSSPFRRENLLGFTLQCGLNAVERFFGDFVVGACFGNYEDRIDEPAEPMKRSDELALIRENGLSGQAGGGGRNGLVRH